MTTPLAHAGLQVLQIPYSTDSLEDLTTVLPSLKALLLCGEWKADSPFNAVLCRLLPKSSLRVLHLPERGKQEPDLDAVLLQLQGEDATGLKDFHLSATPPDTTMYDVLVKTIQANSDTLVYLHCPQSMVLDPGCGEHQIRMPNLWRLEVW